MKSNKLGQTDFTVKIIGFGGLPLQRISEKRAIEVVRYAYEKGINFFDTARSYTNSEERIGSALKDVRDEVIIATKERIQSTGNEMIKKIEQSLKSLKTDYIDIYQIHYLSSENDWNKLKVNSDILDKLYELKNQGIIRSLGVTSHNPALIQKIVNEDIFDTVMVPYNYLTTEPEEGLLSLCRRKNVGTIIMKPLAGGALRSASIALKYVLCNEDVQLVIPGMVNKKEVDENVSIANGNYHLKEEELMIIDEDRQNLGSHFCRWCDYCKICPQEIQISFIFRMERNFPDNQSWTENTEHVLKNAINQEKNCTQCGLCEQMCPYNLNIIKMLPEKAKSLEIKLKQRKKIHI